MIHVVAFIRAMGVFKALCPEKKKKNEPPKAHTIARLQ